MTLIDIRTAVLQVLLTGDSYGLEIIERIKEGTGGRMIAPQGRVYPVLRELESEGLLDSYEAGASPERGGRPRRYYHITAEGRRVAREHAEALAGLLRPALGVI